MTAHTDSILKPDTLYFGDDGQLYCGRHCGFTAQLTGRDLHGTRMVEATPADAKEFADEGIDHAGCEHPSCDIKLSVLVTSCVITPNDLGNPPDLIDGGLAYTLGGPSRSRSSK